MSDSRIGEEQPPPERRERVFRRSDGWWFTTREGRPMGPYDTETEARRGLADFIEFIGLAPLDTYASLTGALTPDDPAGGEPPDAAMGYADDPDRGVALPKPNGSGDRRFNGGDTTGIDE